MFINMNKRNFVRLIEKFVHFFFTLLVKEIYEKRNAQIFRST